MDGVDPACAAGCLVLLGPGVSLAGAGPSRTRAIALAYGAVISGASGEG